MPRVAPITGKSDMPAEYPGVVDEVSGGAELRQGEFVTVTVKRQGERLMIEKVLVVIPGT